MKDHFLEMKFGMVIKDHLEIMVVDHLEMKFGMGRRPFGMGMKGYTMRQNKDVFELFHNFDIPLNYLNITAMKSNPKTKKKNLIYKGKIDYFRVFSITYETSNTSVFILSHTVNDLDSPLNLTKSNPPLLPAPTDSHIRISLSYYHPFDPILNQKHRNHHRRTYLTFRRSNFDLFWTSSSPDREVASQPLKC